MERGVQCRALSGRIARHTRLLNRARRIAARVMHASYCTLASVAHSPLAPARDMTSIPAVTDKRFDTALLVLRLVVGTIFIMHGYQKVFTIGIASITTMFTHMGVPFAALVAPLVAVLELVGGIAIVLGVVTRIAGLLLAIDMFCAILIVHAKNG